MENVVNEPLNVNNIVKLLKSYTGASNKKLKSIDRLPSSPKQNQVLKLIRELKQNGNLSENVSFAMRNADQIFDLLWRLVCQDIVYVWKQGAIILRNESEEALLVAPFQMFDEESNSVCRENPLNSTERNPVCIPSAESCILDMVNTQLKMTSDGCRLNCRALSDLSNSNLLCALLNAFIVDIFPSEFLINDRSTTDLVLRTIEDIFEIRSPFTTEDLFEGNKMSICAYFCFFFMVACRYRQCRAVITEIEHLRSAIVSLECIVKNTVELTKEKTLKRKYEHLKNIKTHRRNLKSLEERFDPQKFGDWIQRVEMVKKKIHNIVRQKMEEIFETITISRETTVAKFSQTTGINMSLTTGYGYYLCKTPETVPESQDIILKDKLSGKFVYDNKKKIRTNVGLLPSSVSILHPSKYPKYEIFLELTSKNQQLANGGTFLYQVFPFSDSSWKQQFIKAAKENDSKTVLRMARFCKEDPDFINWVDSQSGNTALHYAARHGKLKTVVGLLECGADFDCQNKMLSTPLHLAVASGHAVIIHMLIEWGCDLSLKDEKHQTALEITRSSKLKQFMTETYNHYLSTMPAIMNGDCDLLLKLIKDHINRRVPFCSLSSRCVSGSTLLHTAVHWGDTESIDNLLQLGVNPDVKDYKGATPLHRSRDSTSSMILLEAGADINATDNDGNTPLHIKCYEKRDEYLNNLELISLLLERNADIIKRNNTGLLPIHCSAMQGRSDIIDYLIKMDTNGLIADALREKCELPTLMYLALAGGFLSCAYWLLEKKFRLLKGESEKLLYEIVCKQIKTSKSKDILEFLFEYGVDVNFQFQNKNTALHYICRLGSSEFTVKSLLEHGACVNVLNEESMSPLMVAVKDNNLKMAAILLQAGASMTKENDYDQSALDFLQDPDEWVNSDLFSEEIKELVIDNYWQTAKDFIQKLTLKVRSEKFNNRTKKSPISRGSTSTNYDHSETVSPVQHLPKIFITSGDSSSFPKTVLKPQKI